MEHFFETLLEKNVESKYNPTILSGPAKYTANDGQQTNSSAISVHANAVVDGPWVVLLEHVLSDDECDHLIELGQKQGYQRSMGDKNTQKFDGTIESSLTPIRTSENAWCIDECYDDPKVQDMTARIEALTGIARNHSEYWQLLRYEVGQVSELTIDST